MHEQLCPQEKTFRIQRAKNGSPRERERENMKSQNAAWTAAMRETYQDPQGKNGVTGEKGQANGAEDCASKWKSGPSLRGKAVRDKLEPNIRRTVPTRETQWTPCGKNGAQEKEHQEGVLSIYIRYAKNAVHERNR